MTYNPETGVVTSGADKNLCSIVDVDSELFSTKNKEDELQDEMKSKASWAALVDRRDGESDLVSTFNKRTAAMMENTAAKHQKNTVLMEEDSLSSASALSSQTKMGAMMEVNSVKTNASALEGKMEGMVNTAQGLDQLLRGLLNQPNTIQALQGAQTPPAPPVGGSLASELQHAHPVTPAFKKLGEG